MNWYHPDKFETKRPFLEQRTHMIRAVRTFFDAQGYREVQTPVLQTMPTADTHIHGFQTDIWGPDLCKVRDIYLQTSPEFDMKKLLVAGMEKIYQLCPVFRNGEDTRLHSPEFTMLEWYSSGADYRDLMDETTQLLCQTAEALSIKTYRYGGHQADPFASWDMVTVAEAFERYAEISLDEFLDDTDSFRKEIAGKGIRVAEDDAWDDLFFRVMAEKIEPHLGMGVPAVLYDYPASMASLARKKVEDPRYAERFEVYVCGVELANGFGELTQAAEQRARFNADMAEKKRLYGYDYPIDEEFLQALEYGMPDCAGIALGIDRLAMLATGAEHISQVLWTGQGHLKL